MKEATGKFIKDLKKTSPFLAPLLGLNIFLIFFQMFYLALRFKYLNSEIPFWYTKPWGDLQLASKNNIILIPLITMFLFFANLYFVSHLKKQFLRYGELINFAFITSCNLLLTLSLLRIIRIASIPFTPLINPEFLNLLLPLSVSLIIVYFITPRFIELAKEKGLVTNPDLHKHPGMILTKPSSRGGGIVFVIGFILTSVLFIKFSPKMLAIFISIILAGIIGLLDDIQNTHIKTRLKFIENPTLRLVFQALIIAPILIAGIQINFIGNPFNGIISFNKFIFPLGGIQIAPLSLLVTLIWIIWIINLLSWSNGVDGQFGGIVGIAAVLIAIIALKLNLAEPVQKDAIKLAMIAAGASFGLVPHTWNPSKIMWGFGAISAGLVLSAISIIIEAKIATSIIVLLIPFLDGSITILRRIIQGRSPLKGDNRHLHHLLIARGWSVKKVAVFYWVSTAATGAVGIWASNKDIALAGLMLAGIAAFIIILLNLRSKVVQKIPQQFEL